MHGFVDNYDVVDDDVMFLCRHEFQGDADGAHPLRPTSIQSTTNNFPYPPPASETIVESSAHRPARSLQSARPKPASHEAANGIIPQLSRPSVGPISVVD